jgi:hypothetical protein
MSTKCDTQPADLATFYTGGSIDMVLGRKGPKPPKGPFGPNDSWGLCEGMCQAGSCVLGCEGPTCCYTKKDEAVVAAYKRPTDLLEPAVPFKPVGKGEKGPKPVGGEGSELVCWE